MKTKLKETYLTPEVEVLLIKSEGIICSSGENRDPWEEDD